MLNYCVLPRGAWLPSRAAEGQALHALWPAGSEGTILQPLYQRVLPPAAAKNSIRTCAYVHWGVYTYIHDSTQHDKTM